MIPRKRQPKKRINARVTIQAYQNLCALADRWGTDLTGALQRLLIESEDK